MTELIAKTLAEYGSLIFEAIIAIIGFILSVIGRLVMSNVKRIDKKLNKLDTAVFGDEDGPGILTELAVLDEQNAESRKDIDRLFSKMDAVQTQIVENQKTLTNTISKQSKETSKEFTEVKTLLGHISGYLEGKK